MAIFRRRPGLKEEGSESNKQSVAGRQVRRSMSGTAKDDQLLLEQEILGDDRSHATGTTQFCGQDGQVKQGEQEILHARDSVVGRRVLRNVASLPNCAESQQFETDRRFATTL
jgi:hypothetical protein